MVLIPILPNSTAYAQEEEFEFELLFVTTWGECSQRNWDAMWYYESITRQYLKMNGISGNGHIDCRSLSEANTRLNLGDYLNHDLLIIIPDYWYSAEYIESSNRYGHHAYYKDSSDIIMSNARTILIEDWNSTWTLSHELMHFVIAYKQYDWKYHEDYVHKIDSLYKNTCKYQLYTCPNVYDVIRTPSGKYMPVLKPMPEPYNPNEKQSSYITSTVNGYTMTQITNGQDSVCYGVKLTDSRGNPIANASIDLHKEYYTEDKTYRYQKSATTNSYGKYTECQQPFRFGTTDNILIHVMAEFDGNSKFKPDKSDLATVLVYTPWKNLNTK